MTLRERWRALLEGPRLATKLAALAAALTAPSIFAGLCTEDYVFRAIARTPLSLDQINIFGGPDVPGAVRAGQEAGVLPWLAPETLRLSFWRPLSSLTHRFDYRVLGDAVPLMHLESIALYALLVFVATRLCARWLEPAWVAGLAALLFAIDDAHGHAVGWLANRNAILAGVFGFAALLFHDRWRRSGDRRGAVLAPLCLALAFVSGEIALGVLGYFLAHALTFEPRGRRASALAPAFGVTAAWAFAYRSLDHGTRSSGTYLDPLRAPGEYLRELPERLGTQLLGQLGFPPADAWTFFGDRAHWALALGGFVALAGVAVALGRDLTVRDSKGAVLRFAAMGMILSLLPACATFPSDRTLLFAGLGASILLAHALGRAANRESRAARVLGAVWVTLHLVVAPLLLPLRSLTMTAYHNRVARAAESAYALVKSADERLVVVNAPDYYFCSLLRILRVRAAGEDAPPMICLAGTLSDVDLARIDDNTLEVRSSVGFLSEPFNRIYRSRRNPMHVGQRVFVGTAEAEVTAVNAGGEPLAASFRFIWPLDSEKLKLVSYRDGLYRPMAPPGPGQVLRVGR